MSPPVFNGYKCLTTQMVPVKITHHKNKTKKCKCGKETFGEVEGNNGSEREVFFKKKKVRVRVNRTHYVHG